MINYLKKNKEKILNLSLKKIYRHFFLNNITPTGYYSYLKDLIFEFLQSKYPSYKKEDFEEKIDKLISEADDYRNLNETSKTSKTFIHLYGKKTVKPGRKMGHINRIVN